MAHELAPIQLELERNDSKASVRHVETTDMVPVSAFSLLSAKQTFRLYWKSVMFCLFCTLGAAMDGYQGDIPGAIIANQGFINQFGTVINSAGNLALDPLNVAAWGGIYRAGVISANISGGFISDYIGRRGTLALMTLILAIGNVLELVAQDWKIWGASRVFTGFGTGLTQTQCVIYVAELAPLGVRGTLLASYAFGYSFGNLVGNIALQILVTSSAALEYKRALLSQWVFTGLFTICLVFMPETPWFYARKGDAEGAKKSLQKTYGNCKQFDVDNEYEVMKYAIEEEKRFAAELGRSKWIEIFQGSNMRRFWISASIPLFAQFSGSALINSYTTYFFQLAGLANPFLGGLIVSIVGLTAVSTAFYTSDKLGRRPIVLTAGVVMSSSLLIIAGLNFAAISSARGSALITFTCMWAFAYNAGVAPAGPAYQGETAAARLRAKTNSLSQATAQCIGLIWNYCVPLLLNTLGLNTAWIFFATGVSWWIVLFFLLPEYRRRSYAELDEMFEKKISARKFKAYRTTAQDAADRVQAQTAA